MVYETWTLGKGGAEDLLATDDRRDVALRLLPERAGKRSAIVVGVVYGDGWSSQYTAARATKGVVEVFPPVRLT